jgi:hypothetical protein
LKQYLTEHPQAVAHERIDNLIVLTAATASLRDFVQEHLETEDAFADPLILERPTDQ